MFSLSGKTALVFGGTAGIGLAVARRFADAGARVVVVGRREKFDTGSPEIGFLSADVAREKSVREVFKRAVQDIGKIDILVNNAGVGVTHLEISREKAENVKEIIDVNILGVLNALKHGPQFLNDGASIINTSSVGALLNVAGYGAYSMSKAAVISLTKTSAIELGGRGVRVNAVCPGSIQTSMLDRNPREAAFVSNSAPLGRIGTVEDVAGLYHFLASDESRYITGTAIPVDGGIMAGLSNRAVELMSGG